MQGRDVLQSRLNMHSRDVLQGKAEHAGQGCIAGEG